MKSVDGIMICDGCGSRSHRLWTEPGKPKDSPDTIKIGDQELGMNPPSDLHFECMECKRKTVFSGCYIIDRKAEYENDSDTVTVEEIHPVAESAAEAARRAMKRMREEGEI